MIIKKSQRFIVVDQVPNQKLVKMQKTKLEKI